MLKVLLPFCNQKSPTADPPHRLPITNIKIISCLFKYINYTHICDGKSAMQAHSETFLTICYLAANHIQKGTSRQMKTHIYIYTNRKISLDSPSHTLAVWFSWSKFCLFKGKSGQFYSTQSTNCNNSLYIDHFPSNLFRQLFFVAVCCSSV